MRLTGRSLGYGAVAYGAAAVFGIAASSGTAEANSGGWKFPHPRFKTAAEVLQERIDLGILPAPVKKVVEKAVRRAINKAKAQEQTQETSVNPLIWLREHHAQEQAALAYELQKRDLQFDIQYMALVRYEIERLQAEEDEQIIQLLMEL